jgi:hypothetical protein
VKAVYGYFAAPSDRPAGGGPAIPVRVLTSLEIAAGGYIVEGGAAMPVYDAPAGTPEMGGAAMAVYALNGVAAWPFSYLLRDEFTDTLSAGSVNGTPAVPGPGGARLVVDAENKLSLSGGNAVFSGGKITPAYGDPGLWYGGISRIAGRLIAAKMTRNSGTGGFGFDTGQSGGFSAGGAAMDLTGTTLRDPLNSVTIGLATAGISYQFAISLRSSGAFHFVRGGTEYPDWRLLWIHNIGSTATLYPSLLSFDISGNCDYLRIPQSLYIPTPLAYAAFGGADGPLGNTDAVGPDGQVAPVLAWVDQVGTWAIASGKATASALVGGEAIATVLTTSPDIHIRAKLTRAGGNVGIIARLQNSSNYLRAYHDGTNAVCQQVVAGVPTTLRTGAAAFVASAYIYLIVSGTIGWLFYNNAAIGASFTVPASEQKNHGLYTTNTGNTMDEFEAWPYGTGGEHAFLGLI